jgi:ribosomal protein S18 acetylase RimI-like enzyme
VNSDPVFQSRVRQAGVQDQGVIHYLIENHDYYHHHLDWLSPGDWLGKQPFLILNSSEGDTAAIACPADVEGVGWIRLFVTLKSIPYKFAWKTLWENVSNYAHQSDLRTVVGLAFTDWYADLLVDTGFFHSQDVVTLSRGINLTNPPEKKNPDFFIRKASRKDLTAIAALDKRAFISIWQHPLPIMEAAYDKAGYISVVEFGNEIVGYQLSTVFSDTAHLARLAVEPRLQNRKLGQALINDIFRFCIERGIEELTVNTQSDNPVSLALYRKMGFEFTGEKYPVFVTHLS